MTQPLVPASNPGLEMRFAPVPENTSTLSSRHSPSSRSITCRAVGESPPSSSTPVVSRLVHGALLVSSLSAQFDARRLSARASINSRLLPPPSDQCPQLPPWPYSTSSTTTSIRLVVAGLGSSRL